MKKIAKIWIITAVLSLLAALFAVSAFAEADTATVVYPDGTEVSYAVGETIAPIEAEGGLYYGKGNTLYKDDSVSGWRFTLEGADAPLTSLTVTEEMAGRRILASGFDRVYYTSLEKTAGGTALVYHLKDDAHKYFSTSNTGDRGDGTNTGAYSYTELRKTTTERVDVTLYADVSCSSFVMNWFVSSNRITGRPVYFDLNGHTVKTTQTSYIDLFGITIHIYSSKEGAHWYQTESKTGLCRPNDDGTIYLGDDGSGLYTDNISFHLRRVIYSVHGGGAYIVGGRYYQAAPSGVGGFLEIGRRVKALENATFYLYEGEALFSNVDALNDSGVGSGTTTVKSCTFYAPTEAATMYSEKTATPRFSGCNFVNVRMDVTAGTGSTLSYTTGCYTNLPPRYNVGKSGTSVFAVKDAAAKEIALTMADGTQSTEALFYRTAAVAGGVTVTYDGGESQLRLIGEDLAWKIAEDTYTEGGVLYKKTSEVHTFTLADGTAVSGALATEMLVNKTVRVKSTATYAPVFFSVSVGDAVTYHTDRDTYADALAAYLANMENGATVTLYGDVTLPPVTVAGQRLADKAAAESASYRLDLNGYKITFSGSGVAMRVLAPDFRLYSSAAGGEIEASAHALFVTDRDDYKYIGGAAYGADTEEYGADTVNSAIRPLGFITLGGAWGENLTVTCASLNREILYGGAAILGGTYLQSESAFAPCFLLLSHPDYNLGAIRSVENATFVLCESTTAFLYYRSSADMTLENCRFISKNGHSPLFFAENPALPSDPTFDGCEFYNALVAIRIGGRTVTYTDCAFGFASGAPAGDLDPTEASAYFVSAEAARNIEVLGATYTLEHALFTSPYPPVTVQYPDGEKKVYFVGESIAHYAQPDTYTEGKSLYKLVGEGWTYSLSGKPIEGNVIPREAAGKTLYASGYEYARVYYTSLEQTALGSVLVYHLASDLGVYFSTDNLGDRGDGTNSGAFSYQELRKSTTTKVEVTLYADFALDFFDPCWYDEDNRIGGRPVYLDLNGFSVTLSQSAEVLVRGMHLYIYSTASGAEWHHESAAKMFRVDNDAALYLGDLGTAGANKSHITFYGKSLFLNLYGGGASIYGGIYRQSAPSSFFIEIARRVQAIENATFYLCDGSSALFGDTSASIDYSSLFKGSKAIGGCDFRASSSVFMLYALEGRAPKLVFDGCTLEGVLEGTVGGEAVIVYPSGEKISVAFGETVVPPEAQRLYTDEKGVLMGLVGESWRLVCEDGTPLSSLTVKADMVGKTYVLRAEHTYKKVLYTAETAKGTAYNVNTETYALDFMLLMASLSAGTRVTLYEDIAVSAFRVIGENGATRSDTEFAAQYLDLNGHTLTVEGSGSAAIGVFVNRFYLYSSAAGASIEAPSHALLSVGAYEYALKDGKKLTVNGGAVLGESEEDTSRYGKNLTVTCRAVFGEAERGSVSLSGVTLKQSGTGASPFLCFGNAALTVRGTAFVPVGNAPMLLCKSNASVLFEDALFINAASEAIPLFAENGGMSAAAPKFSACSFFNVIPASRMGVELVSFAVCDFGFVGAPDADSLGELLLASIPSRTVLVGGKPYIFSYELVVRSGDGCTVVYPGGFSQCFPIGSQILPFVNQPFYTGEDGNYYGLSGEGWRFLLNGAELSSLTVTEAMLGKTVEAVGYERVYFTVEVNGAITAYTNASTYASDLKKYLGAMEQECLIRLYADVSLSSIEVVGKRLAQASIMTSASYTLDINGRTLTFTGTSGAAMDVKAANFYIYSSTAGGRILAEQQTFFFSDNDDYKWVDGKAVFSSSSAYKNSSESAIKPASTVYIGELSAGATVHGKNLTVVCKAVNQQMYGSGVYFRGGTFVQSDESTASYFLLLSRTNEFSAHVKGVANTTFVLKNSATAFLNYGASTAVTFDNCKFISASGAIAPLFLERSGVSTAPVFKECLFYDVLPKLSLNNLEFKYRDCAFDFSGSVPTEDMDARENKTAFFAPTDARDATANGTAYTFHYTVIASESGFVTVYYPDGSHAIFYVGESITPFTDAPTYRVGTSVYADLGAGWQFTLNGTALSDLTVTTDMVNKAVYATGYARIYFTVTVNGTVTYYTDGATYATDLKNYLGAMDPGARITLYEDVTLPSIIAYGKRSGDKALMESAEYFFDLNGRTLTFSSTGTALTVRAARFYLYSSVSGGRILAENATFINSDNDDYKWIGGAAVGNSTSAYKNATDVAAIKPSAIVVIGEASMSERAYGDHLTVVCACVNSTLYGTGVAFRGGRFVQSDASEAEYFFYISRIPQVGTSRTVENLTFLLKNPATAFASGNAGETITVRDCRFISEGGTVPFFHADMTASPRLTFADCAFYDGTVSEKSGSRAVTYTDCVFGFSGFVSVNGNVPIAHSADKVLVEGYALDCRIFTSLSEVCTVVWGDCITEYWMLGTAPYCVDPEALDRVMENADGTASLRSGAIIEASHLATVTEAMLGREVRISVSYLTVLPLAFTYTDSRGRIYYALMPDGADAAAIGDLFHEAFNTCGGAYTIKLHADLLLTKGIGWGPLGVSGSAEEYKSLQNGSVTLDLNGFTVTVAEDCVAINASNSNSLSSYPKICHGIFAFEISTDQSFTLTSSRFGGRIHNLSSSALFVVGEQANISLVIEGENLSIDSLGTIFYSFETDSEKTAQLRVQGGTYTYGGSKVAIAWVGKADISDAELYLTGSPYAVFGAHFWKRSSDLSVKDSLIFCESASAKLFTFVTSSLSSVSATMTSGITHKVSLTDTVVLGFALPSSIENVSSLVYDGVALTDTEALLALYGGTAPEGTSLALLERTVNGTTYRLYAYLPAERVGVVDWGFGLPTELWKLGETATRQSAVVGTHFGYTFLPTLVDASLVAGQSRVSSMRPGILRMSLTLQGTIGLNLFLAEALGATAVTVAGTTYTLADMQAEGGYYTFTASIAPNLAHIPVKVTLHVGAYEHAIGVSIEQYAAAILATDAYAAVHDLTYAMVEHVEAQTGTRLALCEAPEGYRRAVPTARPHANEGKSLLESIAFRPYGTISVALLGEAGTAVNLVTASGRSEHRVMTEGVAIFDNIYINEFFGELTVRATKGNKTEVYTYSLENYLYYQTDPALIEKVESLYNYTYLAHLYADVLTGVYADADCDHLCDICKKSKSAHTDADADGVCEICAASVDWSEGFTFAENADGASYTLTGIGSCADMVLRIPATYLGKSVSAIGAGALSGAANIRRVILPSSVTSIGANAFKDLTSLEAVELGALLASVSENAFAGCTSLSAVYYGGRAAGWRAISVAAGNAALTDATVFFYNEYLPETDGYFWCYGEDGEILIHCKDMDRDHRCDDCGAVLTACRDEFGDHLCDICGKNVSSCADGDKDHLCDVCGAVLSTCADGDRDHLCDICKAVLSSCTNGNGDHLCDYCGERITPCTDVNRDHICEICGEAAGACEDASRDHLCDICESTVTLCKDENGDHLCDICDRRLTEHADGNADHLCDLCGAAVTACTDADSDHICDTCEKALGEHADANADHLCDGCGEAISACLDADGDHACDVCKKKSEHTDADRDHLCDICDAALSSCTDADKDHLCDLCEERLSSCKDENADHLCDGCFGALGDHADANADHLCDLCGVTLSYCKDGGDALCALCGKTLASEGLRYRLKSDGTYAVISIGDCKDTYLYIPNTYNGAPVTEIASLAFAARREIVGASIPDSVTRIGFAAFSGCVSLRELTVGDGVKEIGSAAFSLCFALESVSLGDGVETVGLAAFADCYSLKDVSLGSGLRTVQLGAFAGCVRLEQIALPEGLKTVGLGAFSGCKSLKSVLLPASTLRIGHGAFSRCASLESILYAGDGAGFAAITVAKNNRPVLDAKTYFYTASAPTEQGSFWYYGEDGAILTATLCTHTDANHNLLCDLCGAPTVCSHVLDGFGDCLWCSYFACVSHKDNNHDLLCDLCGAAVSCTEHADTDRSGRCDYCDAPFTCTAHTDGNADGFCDACGIYMQNLDFAWESEEITFEINNHSNGGALSSFAQSFMAGDVIRADSATADLILARNAAAQQETGVSVKYRYLPDLYSDYAWSKNFERIAVMQEKGSYADVYCNFGYDMLGASLLGCFANLKAERSDNHFNFAVNEFYGEDIGDGEGYMYEYMESLAFDEDRMYLLASDYFIDAVRAFYCMPVNAAMLEAIGGLDVLGLGRENTAEDLARAVAEGKWTYETLLRYSAVYGDTDGTSDTVGLALSADSLTAAGLLYTSSVRIFGEAENEALYLFADQLDKLMGGKGALLEEGGVKAVRDRFTDGGALFGGVVLLGTLEATAYREMQDGVLILPVPVHMSGVEYATRIHDTGRVGAISAKSDKLGPASAFLNYQSTHSGAVLSSYFVKDLTVGALAESEALKLLNLDMLALMRESVGSQSEQAAENAYHLLASHIGAISPAGEITLGMLRWQDVLAAERYDSTYARSYYRMLREEKTRIAQAIFLNGATSLPR